MEANQNMQNYHRLFLVSQERYDRLSNLAGSGGACGFKDSSVSDSTSTDSQFSPSITSAEDGIYVIFIASNIRRNKRVFIFICTWKQVGGTC